MQDVYIRRMIELFRAEPWYGLCFRGQLDGFNPARTSDSPNRIVTRQVRILRTEIQMQYQVVALGAQSWARSLPWSENEVQLLISIFDSGQVSILFLFCVI